MAGSRTGARAGQRPRPVPCGDQHGRERTLGARPRPAARGRTCRGRHGSPPDGGVGAVARDHHADALRVFVGQLAAPARRSRQPDVPAAEVPGRRGREHDLARRPLQRHRTAGPHPGGAQTQHRASRRPHARRELPPFARGDRLLRARCAAGGGQPRGQRDAAHSRGVRARHV